VVACLAGALVARPSGAQEAAGLAFDVSVVTGDSAAGPGQTGRGWIAGKRTRLDLRGGMPGTAMPGMGGDNVSIIVLDSSDAATVAMVMHDTKKFMYPSRMMEQLKEMMQAMPEMPKMSFSVSNVVVDTLGAGETISGFATKRYRLRADIAMSMAMMGEFENVSMHMESEGDFSEELAEFSDPLQDTRGFKSMMSGMPWADSASTAEMEKLARAVPRGLALRQVDRVTGVTESGEIPQTTTTRFSNVRRENVPLAMFAIPEGYTEMQMPMMGDPGVN
jgi:hypothetical protein